MTIAVTGGTGFIGRHLVNHLLANDGRVRVLTRQPELVSKLWPTAGVEPWPGDLTRIETLHGFSDNSDVIYHLAGELQDHTLFEAVNVEGTRNLLDVCCVRPPRRFIHLSSVGVIGAVDSQVVDETTPCRPQNDYEKSKYKGEQLVVAAAQQRQLAATVVRPTIVFGEETGRGHDSFAAWMRAIKQGRFRFIGTAEAQANYVYVGDVIRTCIALAESTEPLADVYIVSDSCSLRTFVAAASEFLVEPLPGVIPYAVAYVLAVAFEGLGKAGVMKPPLTRGRIRALTSKTIYKSDRLRRTSLWRDVTGWRQGLKQTIAWYEQHQIV